MRRWRSSRSAIVPTGLRGSLLQIYRRLLQLRDLGRRVSKWVRVCPPKRTSDLRINEYMRWGIEVGDAISGRSKLHVSAAR